MFTRFAVLSLLVWFTATAALAQAPADADARQATRKKLVDATRALSEAISLQAKAEARAAEAPTAEAREVAAKEAADARKKVTELRQEVAKLNQQAIDAATTQAALARRGIPTASQLEREHADPHDPFERFALLTPGGPLVLQVALTIDGQPFRTAREKLIDEMLTAADKDKDGKVGWNEALATPQFTLGRLGVANDETRQAYMRTWDKNGDTLVDLSEARQFLAQLFQGPAFTLGGGAGYTGPSGALVVVNGQYMVAGGGQADVQALLDADKDGTLSGQEIDAAAERLKSRDADDNDWLYPQEISGPAATQPALPRLRLPAQQPSSALLLGPTARAAATFQVLKERYGDASGTIGKKSFSALPQLFEALDKNEDDMLQQDEVLALNDVEPQVSLSVALGAQANGQGLTLKSLAPEIAKTQETTDSLTLALPGVRVALIANSAPAQTVNYNAAAASYINQFDKDKNGYLEKSEVPANFGQQFTLWDADEDGKVYAKDISAAFARLAAPQATQVVANVASQGNSLFQTLDSSGDGRLSVRELLSAKQRIRSLDKDQDGNLTQGEIPATFSVTLGLGSAGFGGPSLRPVDRPAAVGLAADGPPEWFTRMDRNGDGDLTLKEFLGDGTDFRQLDTNRDGLIEPKEARAAVGGE